MPVNDKKITNRGESSDGDFVEIRNKMRIVFLRPNKKTGYGSSRDVYKHISLFVVNAEICDINDMYKAKLYIFAIY